MFCPSCGKEVSERDAFCRWCAHSLSPTAPSSELSPKGVLPGADPAHPLQRNRLATASLILALFSLIPITGFLIRRASSIGASIDWFYLWDMFGGVFYRPLRYMFVTLRYLEMPLRGGLLPLLAGAGLLGIIFGHRARSSTPRIGGTVLGKGKAALGLVLGYMAVTGWIAYGTVNFVVMPYAITPVLEQKTIKSNEQSAIECLHSIDTAATSYSLDYKHGYPPSLAVMGPPNGIDPNLPWDEQYKLRNKKENANATGMLTEEEASGTYDGYKFTYSPGKIIGGHIATFTVNADPLNPGKTGNMHYFTDESGVIRYASRSQADAESPPI